MRRRSAIGGGSAGPRRLGLRRVLGLALALSLTLPVAALRRLDPVTGAWSWALRPSQFPEAGWPGDWSPVARTVAVQQLDALGTGLALMGLVALLVWLAALADLVLGSLRPTAPERQEWAVRAVVGASARQLRAEALRAVVPGPALAASLGLAGAALACTVVPDVLPSSLILAHPAGPAMLLRSPLVPMVLAVTAMAAVGLPLLLVPRAAELRRPAVALGLGRRRSGAGRAGDPRLAWSGDVAWWLAATQVAACLAILLCGTFLLGGAVQPAGSTAAYPYARDTLVLRVDLSPAAERTATWRDVREAAAAVPGVIGASVATPGAWLGLGTIDRVSSDCPGCGGGGLAAPVTVGLARHTAVDEDFFSVLGAHVERGGPEEAPEGPGLVIDGVFRDRLFQGGRPWGRRVWLRGVPPLRRPVATVAGVAEMPAPGGFSNTRQRMPVVYARLAEHAPDTADVAVRAVPGRADLAAAVLPAVRQAAAGGEVEVLGWLSDLVAAQAEPVRLFGLAALILAVAAFLLALSGAHAAIVGRVGERTREIGLRRAVGASRTAVVRLVVGDGARLVAAGAIAGVSLGLSVNRGVPLLVAGLPPLSGAAVAALAILVAVLGVAANLAAVRRVLRLDPVVALRE